MGIANRGGESGITRRTGEIGEDPTNRILVIGPAGSGKSTLSHRIGERLQLPIIHLDKYYWKPNWIPTPNDEWDQFVLKAAYRERWIMDDNYSRTLDLRMKRADVVLFLDMPR